MRKININQVAILLIIATLIYATGRQIFATVLLNRCSRISVSKTLKVTGGGVKAGNYLDYTFKVQGKQYSGSYGLGNGNFTSQTKSNIVAHRYFVRFSCVYPGVSELMYEKEVPSSILDAPTDGWENVPGN